MTVNPRARRLSYIGELSRIGRKLRRQSKGEFAYVEAEVLAGREGLYTEMLRGRAVGLLWAAQTIERRVRELKPPAARGTKGKR